MRSYTRSYGPGKFDTILDKYVYLTTLNGGADEETGDANTTGWFGLVRLGKDGLNAVAREAKEDGNHLTLSEARLIRRSYAAIIKEDDQGFVRVDYYSSKSKVTRFWKQIEKEVSSSEQEGY